MSEQQETFISHLIELRDRVLRAVIAVGIAFLPWLLLLAPALLILRKLARRAKLPFAIAKQVTPAPEQPAA